MLHECWWNKWQDYRHIPFKKEYIELVEQTGKIVRRDKKGVLTQSILLDKFNMKKNKWCQLVTNLQNLFKSSIGSFKSLTKSAEISGYKLRVKVKNSSDFLWN